MAAVVVLNKFRKDRRWLVGSVVLGALFSAQLTMGARRVTSAFWGMRSSLSRETRCREIWSARRGETRCLDDRSWCVRRLYSEGERVHCKSSTELLPSLVETVGVSDGRREDNLEDGFVGFRVEFIA
jgi:hypothetical protein